MKPERALSKNRLGGRAADSLTADPTGPGTAEPRLEPEIKSTVSTMVMRLAGSESA
jgi:hypothetical protein